MTTSIETLPAGTWTLDPATTTVEVTVKKMKVITVTATLAVTSGSIGIADGQVTRVEVVADAASYASPNAKRNEHVAGPDFLDATAHPTIEFSATGGDSTQKIAGTVTIKGKKTPITFNVSDLNVADDSPSNNSPSNNSASFTATTTVDRFALGIDKMPSFVIAKDLDIKVTATAQRQP